MAGENAAAVEDDDEELALTEIEKEGEDLFNQFADNKATPPKAPDPDENEDDEDDDDADDNTGKAKKSVEEKTDKDDPDNSGTDKAAKKTEVKKNVWDDVPEEAKTAFDEAQDTIRKLTHKIKSDDGRVSALNNKIKEMQEKQDENVASPEDIANAFKDEESWKAFAELNPGFAGVFEKFLGDFATNIKNNLEKNKSDTKILSEAVTEQADIAADEAITEVFPDWKEWANTSTFLDWLNEQPPSTMDVVNSGTVEESIGLFRNYENYLKANGLLKTEKQSDNSDKSDKSDKSVKSDADAVEKTKAKRSKQLKDGATTPSKGVSATPVSDDSTKSLFDYFADKKAKK